MRVVEHRFSRSEAEKTTGENAPMHTKSRAVVAAIHALGASRTNHCPAGSFGRPLSVGDAC
jgi:hypothetical protein